MTSRERLLRDVLRKFQIQTAIAIGATSSPTTTSTTYVDADEMTVTLSTSGGDVLAIFSTSTENSGANANLIALSLDGAAEVGIRRFIPGGAGQATTLTTVHLFTGVTPGSHTIKGRWRVSAGTGTLDGTERSLTAVEIP